MPRWSIRPRATPRRLAASRWARGARTWPILSDRGRIELNGLASIAVNECRLPAPSCAKKTPLMDRNLFPGGDLALAAMDQHGVWATDLPARQPRRPPARNCAAPSPAPVCLCDPQWADARERLADCAISVADQKRQAKHVPPNLPLGDNVVRISGGEQWQRQIRVVMFERH